MNLKAFQLSAIVATATIASAALASSPAQAAAIANGSTIQFSSSLLLGGVQYVGGVASPTGLNFQGLFGGSGFQTGPFSGIGTADTTQSGTPTGSFAGAFGASFLKDINLLAPATANFLSFTGFSALPFGTTTFSITSVLDPYTANFASGTTSAKFGGFFQNGSNLTAGTASFSAQTVAQSSYSLTFQAIPTPALLPGLIALGVGVVRKRKSQAVEETQA